MYGKVSGAHFAKKFQPPRFRREEGEEGEEGKKCHAPKCSARALGVQEGEVLSFDGIHGNLESFFHKAPL